MSFGFGILDYNSLPKASFWRCLRRAAPTHLGYKLLDQLNLRRFLYVGAIALSHKAFRVSHKAFRVSHKAFRVSHKAFDLRKTPK
ncbi:MAG: hypothetical protein ACYT04_44935 [Nostoc sp.]